MSSGDSGALTRYIIVASSAWALEPSDDNATPSTSPTTRDATASKLCFPGTRAKRIRDLSSVLDAATADYGAGIAGAGAGATGAGATGVAADGSGADGDVPAAGAGAGACRTAA